jgi:peptide/nickel transport system substrate-binding protein
MRKKSVIILVTASLISLCIIAYKFNNKDKDIKPKDSVIYSDFGETRIALTPEKLPQAAKLRGDTLIVGINAPEGKFNPVYCNSIDDNWVCNLIFEGLISHNASGEPIKNLAESWTVSDDGKTYSFKLKENIKFSNGSKLTAEDVGFTYTALCDKGYSGAYENVFKLLQGYEEYKKGDNRAVTGIKVINPYEISFNFKEKNAALINGFTIGILSKEYYNFGKGNIDDLKEKLMKPMGTGPYLLDSFKQGEEVSLVKNKSYWAESPQIQKIIMKVEGNLSNIDRLITGELDIAKVASTPNNISKLKDAGFLNIHLYEDNGFQYIGLNLRKDKFRDKKVRQALTYGLNRQAFVQGYYGEYGWVSNVPYSKASWAYPKVIDNEYNYDKEKAKKLLQESGFRLQEDGFRYDDLGRRFTINWITYDGNAYVEQLINRVKEDWKAIGVEVIEEVVPFDTLVQRVFQSQDFEMYNMAWRLGVDPDPSPMFSLSEDVPRGYNAVGFRNPEGEKLIIAALKEPDKEKRKELYEKFGKVANEDLPYIYINGNMETYAVSARIKNLELSPYVDWTDSIKKIKS